MNTIESVLEKNGYQKFESSFNTICYQKDITVFELGATIYGKPTINIAYNGNKYLSFTVNLFYEVIMDGTNPILYSELIGAVGAKYFIFQAERGGNIKIPNFNEMVAKITSTELSSIRKHRAQMVLENNFHNKKGTGINTV